MASWNLTEIGITVTEDDIILKKQFMECIGLKKLGAFFDGKNLIDDYDDTRCSGDGEEFYTMLYNKDSYSYKM